MDFISVKLLLIALCGGVVFLIFLISDSTQLIVKSIKSLQQSIADDLPYAIQTGINGAHQKREDDLEFKMLEADIKREKPALQKAEGKKPVFTVDADVVEIARKIDPNAFAGWTPLQHASTGKPNSEVAPK